MGCWLGPAHPQKKETFVSLEQGELKVLTTKKSQIMIWENDQQTIIIMFVMGIEGERFREE